MSRWIAEACAVSNATREIGYLFPLSVETEMRRAGRPPARTPNLAKAFTDAVSERIGLEFVAEGTGDLRSTVGPEAIFHYIYAVLSSPEYRRRYVDFLKSDFPRVPLPGGRSVFSDLTEVGERLTRLSLMEVPARGRVAWRQASGVLISNWSVEKVRFDEDEGEGRVWINQGAYCAEVPREVWEFSVGGYRPARKWLVDRKNDTLVEHELEHYRIIVSAIGETIERMQEVDEIIETHGGWPTAFEPAASSEETEVLPFQRLEERPKPADRYRDCVPLVPLEAAAGAFGEPQFVDEREEFGWVRLDTRLRLRKGMFVAQVVGKSMEPRIPDGAWCLFRSPVTGTRQGRTLLVQLRDAVDPDTGQRYTVKRYESRRVRHGDSWRHERIRLLPVNREFEPIEVAEKDQVRFIAELVEVLGG